jgi:sulfane dehydrogenase subunit SoxC
MASKGSSRRRFLTDGAALAGLAVGMRSAGNQTLTAQSGRPETARPAVVPAGVVAPGARDIMPYGDRSRFVTAGRTRHTMIGNMDMHRDPNGFDASTPIDQMVGILTPPPLHYVSSHGNAPPDIDPKHHRLVISGMVDRPLEFTMEDLMRLPYVSRIHYIECIANSPGPTERTLEQLHGMIGCSEWTGVPLSLLLKEAGVKSGATWILAEGAEPTRHGNSIPMGKAMLDVIVAYGQNGEPVRPQQGFPLRLVVPGCEGKYHVKWLKRIEVVDRAYITYWEQSHFMNAGRVKERYFIEQGPKSVITFPAGEQRLPGPGFYNISGLAWSGGGAVRRVEVSTDGGRTWNDAQLHEPIRRMALTRFQSPWTWKGGEAVLQSRCTDEAGQVQPTAAEHDKFWGGARRPHGNPIQPWRVTNEGLVLNAL